MVGLYHKHKVERSQNRFVHRLLQFVMGFFLVCGALFLLVVLLFNGERIKGPLENFLSEHTGLDVQIERADFSPLYPNIIKLSNVHIGSSFINELYLDYQLTSAFGDELVFRDLYINGLKLHKPDLQRLSESKSHYRHLHIDLLRLHHIPLYTELFESNDSSLRLKQVDYTHEQGLTFATGYLDALQGTFAKDNIKNLSASFRNTTEGLYLDDFSIGIRGGIIAGKGLFKENPDFTLNTKDRSQIALIHKIIANDISSNLLGTLEMDELHLSKLILDQRLKSQYRINIQAPLVSLAEVILINDNGVGSPILKSVKATQVRDQNKAELVESSNFVMQGITGHIKEFAMTNGKFTGLFTGGIGEIAFPELMTTVTQNNCSFDFTPKDIHFSLQGSIYEGDVAVRGTYNRNNRALHIEELNLDHNKLELTEQRLKFLHEMHDSVLSVEKASLKQLEVLSYIDSFPLSVQSLNAQATNWHLRAPLALEQKRKARSLKDFIALSKATKSASVLDLNTESELQLELINAMYSDLRMKKVQAQLALKEKYLSVKLPHVLFDESSLTAEGGYGFDDGISKNYLKIDATDFETADLNSNLLNHLLSGRINLHAYLWSKSSHFLSDVTGNVNLNSEALLISDFGLDLINGGKARDFTLTGTELVTALRGGVAGISSLNWNIKADHGIVNHSGTMGLSTADTLLSAQMNFKDQSFQGSYYLESLPRDSSTVMAFSGTLKDPVFTIHALSRGEHRPGLYLPQYEASALEKELSDTSLHPPYNKPLFGYYKLETHIMHQGPASQPHKTSRTEPAVEPSAPHLIPEHPNADAHADKKLNGEKKAPQSEEAPLQDSPKSLKEANTDKNLGSLQTEQSPLKGEKSALSSKESSNTAVVNKTTASTQAPSGSSSSAQTTEERTATSQTKPSHTSEVVVQQEHKSAVTASAQEETIAVQQTHTEKEEPTTAPTAATPTTTPTPTPAPTEYRYKDTTSWKQNAQNWIKSSEPTTQEQRFTLGNIQSIPLYKQNLNPFAPDNTHDMAVASNIFDPLSGTVIKHDHNRFTTHFSQAEATLSQAKDSAVPSTTTSSVSTKSQGKLPTTHEQSAPTATPTLAETKTSKLTKDSKDTALHVPVLAETKTQQQSSAPKDAVLDSSALAETKTQQQNSAPKDAALDTSALAETKTQQHTSASKDDALNTSSALAETKTQQQTSASKDDALDTSALAETKTQKQTSASKDAVLDTSSALAETKTQQHTSASKDDALDTSALAETKTQQQTSAPKDAALDTSALAETKTEQQTSASKDTALDTSSALAETKTQKQTSASKDDALDTSSALAETKTQHQTSASKDTAHDAPTLAVVEPNSVVQQNDQPSAQETLAPLTEKTATPKTSLSSVSERTTLMAEETSPQHSTVVQDKPVIKANDGLKTATASKKPATQPQKPEDTTLAELTDKPDALQPKKSATPKASEPPLVAQKQDAPKTEHEQPQHPTAVLEQTDHEQHAPVQTENALQALESQAQEQLSTSTTATPAAVPEAQELATTSPVAPREEENKQKQLSGALDTPAQALPTPVAQKTETTETPKSSSTLTSAPATAETTVVTAKTSEPPKAETATTDKATKTPEETLLTTTEQPQSQETKSLKTKEKPVENSQSFTAPKAEQASVEKPQADTTAELEKAAITETAQPETMASTPQEQHAFPQPQLTQDEQKKEMRQTENATAQQPTTPVVAPSELEIVQEQKTEPQVKNPATAPSAENNQAEAVMPEPTDEQAPHPLPQEQEKTASPQPEQSDEPQSGLTKEKASEFEQQLLEDAALESFFGIGSEEEEIF